MRKRHAETRMIEQWLEPEPDWVPLREAVDRSESRHKTIEAMMLARAYDPARTVVEAVIASRQAERPFNRAVSEGKVMVYARRASLSNPFELVGRDVWPVLTIVSWRSGRAIGPDGTKYWSIHVKGRPTSEQQPEPEEPAEQTNRVVLTRDEAIRRMLKVGVIPGKTIPWDLFCKRVCGDSDGWSDQKRREPKRGWGHKSIQRAVKQLKRTGMPHGMNAI
jgi:hypothetical protein